MAHYSIKEIYNYLLTKENRETLLFSDFYDPPEGEAPDTRPNFVLDYENTWHNLLKIPDDLIARDYGNYVLIEDCDTVERACRVFASSNVAYTFLHNAELSKIYEAINSEFNPVENYDRTEKTTVTTDMTVGATTKTAPDDSETFYNVGSGDTTTDGDVTTESRIHGNIGVVDAPTMISKVVSTYDNLSAYDFLVKKLIEYNCILVD